MKQRPQTTTLSRVEEEVLRLLLEPVATEMYGLEMVEASSNSLKRGTIYVTLSRMEEKGLVESRQEERPTGQVGIPRRLYKVTGYGEKVYSAWKRLLGDLTEAFA